MAFEPQRFIHAANVRLDVPVSVQTIEALTDELRFAFEDATLNAFDQVIEACLRLEVDYLVLSGNIFIESDRSLRARLALLRGFNTLNENGIQVFVLPGDTDPAEAWRAIPELPGNVNVVVSSNPEPVELFADEQVITSVSASLWYGRTDDFGIQVLTRNKDGVDPFRIGVVSRVKYEESRRMAQQTAEAADEVLAGALDNVASGEAIDQPAEGMSVAGDDEEESHRVWRSLDEQHDPGSRRAAPRIRRKIQRSVESLEAEPDSDHPSLEPGFLKFVDEMLVEGRLNYLALTGELARTTLWRDSGVVHCPGTTQARSQQESAGGACSLVEVSADGEIQVTSIDTSCVDWKQIEIEVAPQTNLSAMLQQMKTRLMEMQRAASDRIWSVQWILRGPLAVLQELERSDLDVAAAVELDELMLDGQPLRLLHEIRSLPNAWPADDPPVALADQFQDLVTRPDQLTDAALRQRIESDTQLTGGWKQRLTALLPSLDPEQIVARMRTDGAAWFLKELPEDSPAGTSTIDSEDSLRADAEADEELSDDLDESNESDEDDDLEEPVDDSDDITEASDDID